MKKFITTFALLITLSLTSTNLFAFAETNNYGNVEELVKVSVETAYETECYNISVSNYNELESQKYYCTFETNETDGYAIVNKSNNALEVEKICLSNTKYKETGYVGTLDFTNETISIPYSSKSENSKKLALVCPSYNISVSCVPLASSYIIGFYDRYFPDLFPNFTPGRELSGQYIYTNIINNYVIDETQTLANYMSPNSATQGVTISEFKSGFQTFCSRKSLQATYTSCMSNGVFNFYTAKNQLEQNIPIIVFMSEYNISQISNSNNTDTITMKVSTVPHAMAVFGYRTITYTLSNGQTRVDNYLQVSTGNIETATGLLNLNYYIDIDDAYAVNIS